MAVENKVFDLMIDLGISPTQKSTRCSTATYAPATLHPRRYISPLLRSALTPHRSHKWLGAMIVWILCLLSPASPSMAHSIGTESSLHSGNRFGTSPSPASDHQDETSPMNPIEEYRQVLSAMAELLHDEFKIEVTSSETVDLTPLREGTYLCSAGECARQNIGTLYVPNPREAYGLGTATHTGFFERAHRQGNVIRCLIEWDDGSGQTKTESIQLWLLGETSFKLVDSSGSETTYQLME